MSTTPVPGQPVQPASGWFPSLKGANLPRAAINGITQGFSLLYSLRDTVNQQANTVRQLIQYDTHKDRIQTRAQSMPESMLWFESDRPTVFYQTRLKPQSTTRDWYYAGGIYYDLLVNRPRPEELDERDFGFLFLASDDHHLYAWNGKSWDQAL
jgi:hypothetical protein